MLRKIQMFALIFVLLFVLVGCVSNVPTIVGEWYSEQEKINMTINEDGTFHITDVTLQDSDLLAGIYRIEGDQFIYKPTGEDELANTFKLTGDTLVLTYEGYTSTLKRVKE